MKEARLRILVALGALTVALAACGSATNGPNAALGSAGSGFPGGVVSGAGSAGASATSAAGGNALLPDGPCSPGIPETTQIPMLLNRQYANVVRDLLGVTTVDGMPVADSLVGDFTGAMTAPAWKVYQDVGAKIAAQVMAGPNKSRFISCEPAAAGCLKTTIESFGRKAFRRPLSPEEVESFQSLSSVTPAGTPAEVAEATLNAFLVSPSFLMIPELNTDTVGSAIQLSQQEVASRLSFLLWGSVPDDALNAAADAQQLATKEQILAQAQRMIQVRERTGPFVSAFHDQWLQMNNGSAHWFKGKHDPAKYPTYTDASLATNQRELDAFWEEVAYSNGSFQDLLLSNVAFVSKDNAAVYGLDPAKYTDQLSKVMLDSTSIPRPGFLTRAGFLSSYSSYDSTSPILRGSFIATWLLSLNVPPPDPANTKKIVDGTFATQRAYVEALTMTDQPCKGCHQVFNPLGFVLENYDGIGKWQTKDLRGGDIDASVTTASVDFGDGAPAREIKSPVALMQEIAKSAKAQELYAKAWVSFATRRPANANDRCTVDRLKTKLAGNGYTILSLLGELTQADSFRLRVRGPL